MSETESTSDGENASFDTRLWVTDGAREWVNSQKRGSETQADVINHLTSLHEAVEALAGDVPRNPDADDLRDALDTPRSDSETEAVDVGALADAVADRLTGESINPDVLAEQIAEELDIPDLSPEDVRAAAERGTENALENIR